MLTILKEILNNLLYALGLGKQKPQPQAVGPLAKPAPAPGTSGVLTAEALLARDTDRDKLILVVDSDLKDVPAWVDWDVGQNVIGVAQQGGAYATLTIKVAKDHQAELKLLRRLLIVTKTGDLNVVHHVPFIVRDY